MSLNVPTIDISGLPDDPVARDEIARACEAWGFFQIVGHGIDETATSAFLDATRTFFHLPLDERLAVRRDAENPMGFYDEELTKNTRDWKQVYDFGIDLGDAGVAHPSRWPDVDGFRDIMTGWYRRCEAISMTLLDAIEQSLDVAPGSIADSFRTRHTSFLRLNYYPVCDDPAPADSGTEITHGSLGVNRHTDAGALTVLVQDDVPALQVNKDNQWHTIVPEPGGMIINIGDMMQVWSNDRFQAPEHRVIANASRERFSAPFFLNPDYRTDCVPLTTPARYRPVNWGHFRDERASGDYADYGEEIQISQFRL